MRYYVPLAPFILDNFEFLKEDGTCIERNDQVIGGAGTYAAIGARIWLDPNDLGMIVYRGKDFPQHVQELLSKYGSCWVYKDMERDTIKGLNTYKGEHRSFSYLTPRIPLNPIDIAQTQELEGAQYLHLVAPPERTRTIVGQLPINNWFPKLAWEPYPEDCIHQNLPTVKQVLPQIDLFTPNHVEAAGLLGIDPSKADSLDTVIQMANEFVKFGAKHYVVIRCGSKGAFVLDSTKPDQEGIMVPAYHNDPEKIVDVTGAGNSFIGGMIAGLKLSNDNIVEAACYGSVSSSYAIEQWGPATLSKNGIWNKDKSSQGPKQRLQELKDRLLL